MTSHIDKYIDGEITYEELEVQAQRVMGNQDPSPLDLNSSEFALFERLGKDALEEIIDARKHKREIITKWKEFFRNVIATNHVKNTTKLKNIKNFAVISYPDMPRQRPA